MRAARTWYFWMAKSSITCQQSRQRLRRSANVSVMLSSRAYLVTTQPHTTSIHANPLTPELTMASANRYLPSIFHAQLCDDATEMNTTARQLPSAHPTLPKLGSSLGQVTQHHAPRSHHHTRDDPEPHQRTTPCIAYTRKYVATHR